jgi:hypothetical protein
MRSIVALALLTSATASADAEPVEVSAQVLVTGELEVECLDCPAVPLERISIQSFDVRVPAAQVKSYAQVRGPIALAFVINSQELNMAPGNDLDEEYRSMGRGLELISKAFEAARFHEGLPAGSTAVIVGYNTGAHMILPLGPIERLDAKVLGTPNDYRGRIGTDLVTGVEVGLAHLARANAASRVMIVIGDGNDTNNDAAKKELPGLAHRAHLKGITIIAAVWKTALSLEGHVIDRLTKSVVMVPRGEGIEKAIVDPIESLRRRRYLYFPTDKLPHDGKPRLYTVHRGDAPAQPFTLSLAPPPPSDPQRRSLWLYVAIGAAALVLLRAARRVTRRR